MRLLHSRPFMSVLLIGTRKLSRRSAERLKYPSAERNQAPILSVLQSELDANTANLHLLEISSGTGQHSAHFAPHFPNITFQPSEYESHLLPSIKSYAEGVASGNVRPPLCVDISTDFTSWTGAAQKPSSYHYILNINMIHITPFVCTVGLFRNAQALLKPFALLITYGPYAVDGVLAPDSNVRFDAMLRQQNPQWGVRDLTELKKLAAEFGFQLKRVVEMPANNKTIVWQRGEE